MGLALAGQFLHGRDSPQQLHGKSQLGPWTYSRLGKHAASNIFNVAIMSWCSWGCGLFLHINLPQSMHLKLFLPDVNQDTVFFSTAPNTQATGAESMTHLFPWRSGRTSLQPRKSFRKELHTSGSKTQGFVVFNFPPTASLSWAFNTSAATMQRPFLPHLHLEHCHRKSNASWG